MFCKTEQKYLDNYAFGYNLRANMKPYASQVTNSLAKLMFNVVSRRSP